MEKTPKGRKRTPRGLRFRRHDPEKTAQRGMSTVASAADEAETMASTGDAEDAFREVVSGTATGLGVDRGESVGTGGLAAGEDSDVVAEGDYWREYLRRDPFGHAEPSSERYEPGGAERYGWEEASEREGLEPERPPAGRRPPPEE
jgi:hypothetical protein